ncbi:MAG: hypothetical protein ACLQUY_09345 [Ktedonobacterales bacterium]
MNTNDHRAADDLERIEKFVLGLFASPTDPHEAQPRLFVGSIPETLPIELPVPEYTEVLGTLVHSNGNVDIILESELTAEDVLSFYRTRLTPLGWQLPNFAVPFRTGGFVISPGFPPHMPDVAPPQAPQTLVGPVLTFCHEPSGAELTVTVLPQENHMTHVRLKLSLERNGNRCADLARRRRQVQGMQHIIPFLVPPPDAQQNPRMTTVGSHDVFAIAMLTTQLELEAVATHYAEQLQQAGWMEMAQGASGPLAWQTWQFTSEEQEQCVGLFFALHTPEQLADYLLFVRARISTAQAGGWHSHSTTQ